MTPPEARAEIARFIADLLESGLAVASNPPVIRHFGMIRRVLWSSAPDAAFAVHKTPFATVADYRRLLEWKQFNVVLFDGALLQAFLEFRRDELIRQSLTYYPCPVALPDSDAPSYELTGDLIDSILSDSLEVMEWLAFLDPTGAAAIGGPKLSLQMRAPMRFDFHPEAEAPLHPASHLHFGDAECRIPVYAPVSFASFARFVFRNYYVDTWHEHPFLRDLPARDIGRCISREHERELYLECLGEAQ